MLKKINRFFKSVYFLKGIVMSIAMLVPIFFSKYYLNDINIGFSIALGVFFCSPVDVPGSNRHVLFGIFIATLLSFTLTFLFGLIAHNYWLLLPVLGVSVFIISYISVFGFRASLISFVGLLAIVLSFTNNYEEVDLFQHVLLIALGGIWYLLITYIKILLFPKFQTDQLFIKVLEKTSDFLKIRADLLVCTANRNELNKKLFNLQSEINDLHETLRGIILSSRSKSGFSNKLRRQQLVFTELVDILELAISNPVDYEKMDVIFEQTNVKAFQELIVEMANQLVHISKVIRKEERLQVNNKIPEILNNILGDVDLYRVLVGVSNVRVGTLMLLNFKSYQEKQAQNIISIERVLNDLNKKDKILSPKEADRFITPQDYDLKKLTQNLSFNSPLFRHSLRLSIVVLIGFLIGNMFSMQNPYWILLTIIVIQRSSFGLTKSRSIHRVVGTLIGAFIAVVVILLTQNTIIYGAIAVISLPLSFSLIQLNYRNAAVFITLNVIFVYALFEPNILSVVQFRIIDTLIGAALAFAATYFLLPSWQVQRIHEYFSNAMKCSQQFLNEIALFYHEKGSVSTKYKLRRKEAFLAIGELNAAFQRLNQDPKSKQLELSAIYEMTVFNNTVLSALTSLGTFIRNNKTSKVPEEFDMCVENINSNLRKAVNILEYKTNTPEDSNLSIEEVERIYEKTFNKLSEKSDEEIALESEYLLEAGAQLKEHLLVSEQLKWLNNLSEKLLSSSKKYHLNNKSVQ